MPGPFTPAFVWTSTGNYPAGPNPWNGNPLALAPAATYMTPGIKPPAEEMNYILGTIAADLLELATYQQHVPSLLYQPVGASITNFTVPANCFWAAAVAWGGGGGGEGGNQGEQYGTTSTINVYPQGGGGAGGPMVTTLFPTNPGDKLSVSIGGGGPGGVGT